MLRIVYVMIAYKGSSWEFRWVVKLVCFHDGRRIRGKGFVTGKTETN